MELPTEVLAAIIGAVTAVVTWLIKDIIFRRRD
jgi:hypothetical protein